MHALSVPLVPRVQLCPSVIDEGRAAAVARYQSLK